MPDSCPQAAYDYFCIREERMIHKLPIAVQQPVDPWGGCSFETLIFPLQTIGKGHGAVKVQKVAHAGILHSGIAGFDIWRKQVRNYSSDQGAERIVGRAPLGAVATGSLTGEAFRATMKYVFEGTVLLSSSRGTDAYFFPYALDIRLPFHIIFNGLQHAIESLPEWKLFLVLLRGVCKVLATRELKEIVPREAPEDVRA